MQIRVSESIRMNNLQVIGRLGEGWGGAQEKGEEIFSTCAIKKKKS